MGQRPKVEDTPHQAKYFAWQLTRRRRGGDVDRISQSLFDASVDLNPHQIDAALFALQNPLAKGVVLADEVGLGKTIEAALVMSQYWAERRRRLLVICPASLRKQWAMELSEKFHLPTQVLDARTFKSLRDGGVYNPFEQEWVSIISYNFAVRSEELLRNIPWNLVVMDEAHKLRNAHRESHRSGQSIRRSLAGCRKLLLTATPLQNTLLEVYGLSTVIDEHLFGDAVSFRSMYMRDGGDIEGLRRRLQEFVKRTLRKHVLEYIQYTERKPITVPFEPSPDERRLYDLISGHLQREGTYGFPRRQRHLLALVIRKLLASSTQAIIVTLEAVLTRLRLLESEKEVDDSWFERLVADQDLDDELLDDDDDHHGDERCPAEEPIDLIRLRGEIAELEQYIALARGIKEDRKSYALLDALKVGFDRMGELGGPRKAVIFTESVRTQEYLARFLEHHGFGGKVVTFSGRNTAPGVTGLYDRWLKEHRRSDRVTGSPAVDRRTALIDEFRERGEILIATESGAEGINLQFCSLVINYDLPWNPQRVEQRIGRCHRYGQKFDVVVINFLNQHNAADRRVLDLLAHKFHLFDGVFGASDEVLGRLESGLDFERKIADIYDTCRTPNEIEAAFDALRAELEESIDAKMRETEQKLIEHFDADIHELLRIRRDSALASLDQISQLFWRLTRFVLADRAEFRDATLEFKLAQSPCSGAPAGEYRLIRKGEPAPEHAHLYRLSHPLGDFVLDHGRRLEAATDELVFDLSGHGFKIAVLEGLKICSGWLAVHVLELQSFETEEHLVLTAVTDAGDVLDADAAGRMLGLSARSSGATSDEPPLEFTKLVDTQLNGTLNRALDENDGYFQREREKLEQWAEDQMVAAEKRLHDTKDRIKDARRRARTALTPTEQEVAQKEIKGLERVQRRQRQEIFDVEDEIAERRDQLIEALQKRMNQASRSHALFRVRWRLA